ncbi:Uncharacterised protein [Budvicia aquatica]|uniref:Uncharacterized protein n=1 Tax=Budvicia aquatica TaxID=82979 RepID=A0A484ZJJ2_9GAMM|nr:Uncharacterised protein [Budvicia aquatica]
MPTIKTFIKFAFIAVGVVILITYMLGGLDGVKGLMGG